MTDLQALLKIPTRSSRAGRCAVAALFLSSVWMGVAAQRHYDHMQELAAHARRLQAERASKRAPPMLAADSEAGKQWAALKVERDFPWDGVFQAIERTATADIELLEFSPDPRLRILLLRGEAKDAKALSVYLEALARQPQLRNVHLGRRQSVERERLVTVEFEIRASVM